MRCSRRARAVCVVDPRKTKLKAGFAAKTDRLDARRLADALRRESVVSIYVPPPAIRELREVCRGRHQLVRLRTRLAQMIRALLLRCDAGEPPGTRLYAPARAGVAGGGAAAAGRATARCGGSSGCIARSTSTRRRPMRRCDSAPRPIRSPWRWTSWSGSARCWR